MVESSPSPSDDPAADRSPLPESSPTPSLEAVRTGESAEESAERGNSESASVSRPKRRLTMWLGAIALGTGMLIAAVAQWFAPTFDHQNANLISLASLSLASLFFLVCLYRWDRAGGGGNRVPLVSAAVLSLFIICFRFEGFNGEMLPWFSFRLASQPDREIRTVSDVAESVADIETLVPDPLPKESPSDQFLGPNRNAVYPERRFGAPESFQTVKVLWDQGVGEAWSSFAVSEGLAVTLEQRESQECLTCYRLVDGELLWILRHDGRHENPLGGVGPRSTPTIEGQRVYATSATGHLWCADLFSGEVLWSVDVLQLAGWNQSEFELAAPWGYACSPLLVDGLCVVSLGGPKGAESSASLVALDAASGEVRWTSGDDQLSYASPMLMELDGTRQIVSVNENSVTGHDISGGDVLWSFRWPGSTNTGANCSSAVPVGSRRVLVGKGYGGGSALVEVRKTETGWETEDVWRSHRILKTKFNHTCVDGSVGYGISNGALEAVDLEEQAVLWRQPRRVRTGQGQVVLVGDVLVLQDETGDVVFAQANREDYNELYRLPALNAKTWNVPTVAGRYLLVRNDRQAICFELPAR